MQTVVNANEVKVGDLVISKKKVVAIVDAPKNSAVTILHFTDDTKLPLQNEAQVGIERKTKNLLLED